MAATIKSWAETTHAAHPDRVAAVRASLTRSTREGPDDVSVIWIGEHLALVSWAWGGKEVVIVDSVRNESPAERAARKRLVPDAHHLPKRLTGYALAEVIAALGRADEVWTAVVAEERARLAEEERAKADAAQAAEERRKARAALLVTMLADYADRGNTIALEWLAEQENPK